MRELIEAQKENPDLKFISGLPAEYMMSKLGEVYSFKRSMPRKLSVRLNNKGYPIVRTEDGKTKFIHRLVYEYHYGAIPDGYEIDHINGDVSDYSLSNLRIATSSFNKKAFKKKINNTSSIYRGVWRNNRVKSERWVAEIINNGRKIHIGTFKCEHEAATAWNKMALELGWPTEGLNHVDV